METSMTSLAVAAGAHSIYRGGYRVGVNAQGFAFLWVDGNAGSWRAQSYAADGTARKTWTVSERYSDTSPFSLAAPLQRYDGDLVFEDGLPDRQKRFPFGQCRGGLGLNSN